MCDYGVLFGIGVGPGDPDLLTLKAVKVLGRVDRVYAASSSKNTYSTAFAIAQPHLKEGTQVQTLQFPMTRDKDALLQAWQANAARVLDDLRAGLSVAFLTLGDPMTYSTFGYLMRTLRDQDASVPIEVVPGITSYCAAAAASGTILAEGEETLSIVSGARGGEKVRGAAREAENLVILKAYKQFGDLSETLTELDMMDTAVLVSNCGKDSERIVRDIPSDDSDPEYFSLLLVRRKKNNDPSIIC